MTSEDRVQWLEMIVQQAEHTFLEGEPGEERKLRVYDLIALLERFKRWERVANETDDT